MIFCVCLGFEWLLEGSLVLMAVNGRRGGEAGNECCLWGTGLLEPVDAE